VPLLSCLNASIPVVPATLRHTSTPQSSLRGVGVAWRRVWACVRAYLRVLWCWCWCRAARQIYSRSLFYHTNTIRYIQDIHDIYTHTHIAGYCCRLEIMQVVCMYVGKDSAAPAHARTRTHRPALEMQYIIYIITAEESRTREDTTSIDVELLSCALEPIE